MNPALNMAGKNAQPPPLPVDIYTRVLRVARFDGKLLAVIAGTCALLAALGREAAPVIAGVLAAGFGLAEIHGSQRLEVGDRQGLDWMVLAQLGLMLTVLGYAGWMIAHFDPALFVDRLPAFYTEHMAQQFRQAGITADQIPEIWRNINVLTYSLVAVLTVVFQGLRARFYHRARPAIASVLDAGVAP